MMDEESRRNFLKTSAAIAVVAAPAVLPALGANDKASVGWIGIGLRGTYCLGELLKGAQDVSHVTAVCDTYTGHLAKAKDMVSTSQGAAPKTYKDYKDLLADPSVDSVVIMTPEHLHFQMVMDALRAGKNVYVEKPIGHTIEEGAQIVEMAKKSGKVVQVGTQNRSNKLYHKAKEMFDEGMLGEVHYVRAFWYRNFLPNDPTPAAWRYPIPDDTDPENTDWNRFLGSAPKRPFDKHRYFQWRNYWDYSGGISTDLLVHQTDISNFVLGKTVPSTCMASGGIYEWTKEKGDDRDVPDTFSAIYEYPDRFHLNYSCYFGNNQFDYGEQFLGTEGTLEVIGRKDLRFFPQTFGGKAPDKIKNRPEVHLNNIKDMNQPDATIAHIRNWLNAVKGTEKVIAPPEVGQMAAIPGHMATLSYKRGKKILWDASKQKWSEA